MSDRRWRAARPSPWLLGVAFVLAACAVAPPPPRAELPSDPDVRLAAIRASEDQVRSLRARFSSVVELPDGERRADGVLLIAKPDRFRLRLMLPFGITVFDYLNVGERTWTVLPLAGDEARQRVDEFAPFSPDDLGQAFLRGPYAFPGHCDAAPAPGERVWASCREGDVLRRTLLIGQDGIVEEASYEAGAPRLVIRYSDYRAVDAVSLPYRISLDSPQRRQTVDIIIESYQVNPLLSDALFQPLEDGVR